VTIRMSVIRIELRINWQAMPFSIVTASDHGRSHSQENSMYAVSIHPLRARRLMVRALTVVLALGVLPVAHAQQQQAASTAANGADRSSIIFVGGRNNSGSATHARAHPPGPCAPEHSKHSSVGVDCSLNPQPIPPGRSLHKRALGSPASSSQSRTKAPIACTEVCRMHEDACRAPGSKKGIRSCTTIYAECLQECK
jgi:hypothetical protein